MLQQFSIFFCHKLLHRIAGSLIFVSWCCQMLPGVRSAVEDRGGFIGRKCDRIMSWTGYPVGQRVGQRRSPVARQNDCPNGPGKRPVQPGEHGQVDGQISYQCDQVYISIYTPLWALYILSCRCICNHILHNVITWFENM
jgi:hypothetical protein